MIGRNGLVLDSLQNIDSEGAAAVFLLNCRTERTQNLPLGEALGSKRSYQASFVENVDMKGTNVGCNTDFQL